jgi:hypothetical protein
MTFKDCDMYYNNISALSYNMYVCIIIYTEYILLFYIDISSQSNGRRNVPYG